MTVVDRANTIRLPYRTVTILAFALALNCCVGNSFLEG